MKQTIFETRQRAEELLQKAIEIWRKSEHSDNLEGIEKDPVFSLLLTALAYQANETENDIEMMKTEVLEEFAYSMKPFELGHAIPATAVIETSPQDGLPEIELNSSHVFTLGDTNIGFIPLFDSRVLNASVKSVVRMDGRRWKVSLTFTSPVSDLAGFTFAIRNHNYRDLRVTIKGQPVPLVNPWDYSEFPLSPCFAIDTILYNKSQTYMASSLSMDLYARQNVRLYCVRKQHGKKLIPYETEHLDLVFEFTGINDNFVFDKDNLSLNTIILVNAKKQFTTLSAANPIVRVTGFNHQGNEQNDDNQQFLHMLRPSEEQMFNQMKVEVRRMSTDRFNQGSLAKMLNSLINKYYSDYYAFLHVGDMASDKVIQGLTGILSRILEATKARSANSQPGVYLMLRATAEEQQQQASVEISYMTTFGASVNELLTSDSFFVPPTGFSSKATRQIADPVPGFDEIHDERALTSLSRYYMVTNDRIVTPADIKIFCYHELLTRYGIVRDMVKSLTVSRRQQFDYRQCGYEIFVEIILVENTFIKRGFADKIEASAMLLQSMITVRSLNIYPVRVNITIEPENE